MCQQMGWKSIIEFDEILLSQVIADEQALADVNS
jgi:hypothetical protein